MKNKKEEKKTVTNLELSEQNKKLKSDLDGFKRLMILLIILMLVSVISQGLYFYAKIYKEKEETPTIETKEVEKEEEKEEELSIESQEVKSLIQTYDVFNNQLDAANFFGYFYKKDKVTVKDISDKAKIYMALSNIAFVDNKEYTDDKGNVVLPKEVVQEKVKELFGKEVTYKDQALVEEGNDSRMAYFGFDNEKQAYVLNAYGHSSVAYYNEIKTNIDQALKKDKQLEITLSMYKKVVNKDGYTIYKDMESNQELTTLKFGEEKDIFKEYKQDLQQYKYTFVLDEDKYILSSVEKIIKEA